MNIPDRQRERLIEMKTMRKRLPLILALILCVALALPGMTASAENIGTYPVGQEMGWIEFYSSPLPIESCTLSSGYLPAGVQVIAEDNGVYITGVPETTGSFVAEYVVMTSEAVNSAYVSFTVANAPAAAPADRDIVITKSPTGEHVEAGGSAKFVARANNADRIVWRLVSNDTTNTVQCSEAGEFFPGIQVSGLGTDTLVLSNIPKSLDGWRVEAQFWSGSKHAESYGAEITIVDQNGTAIRTQNVAPTPAPAPTFGPTVTFAPSVSTNDLPVDNEVRTANISINPMSAEVLPGQSYSLSVVATSPNNGTLSYQWYSAATNNRSAALPISGASDASYIVNQTDGTAYYWVAVWNTKDGARSQAVYSEAAEVRVVVPATPTPIPTPAPTPTPAPRIGGASSISFQLVLFGIIGVLALIALIGVVIYLRADARQRAEEAKAEKKNKKD